MFYVTSYPKGEETERGVYGRQRVTVPERRRTTLAHRRLPKRALVADGLAGCGCAPQEVIIVGDTGPQFPENIDPMWLWIAGGVLLLFFLKKR